MYLRRARSGSAKATSAAYSVTPFIFAIRACISAFIASISKRHNVLNRGLLQSWCKLALACILYRSAASKVMKRLASWVPAPNLTVTAVE